jgi:hypothetical protein
VRAWLAVPLALAVAGCGDAPESHRLELARIYMGVSCGKPNSIRCDRVGLAVWSPRRLPQIEASIAGRPLTLTWKSSTPGATWDMPRYRRVNYYEGFLSPAGLLDGRLRVRPDGGRHHWSGLHPKAATIRLIGRPASGPARRAVRRVYLAAGWG